MNIKNGISDLKSVPYFLSGIIMFTPTNEQAIMVKNLLVPLAEDGNLEAMRGLYFVLCELNQWAIATPWFEK